MEKRITVKALYSAAETLGGKDVTVKGWARTIRDGKEFGFIELNDGSCFKGVQVVFERANLTNYDEIAKQNVGASLSVAGTLVLTPEAKQPFEIKAKNVTVEGESTPDYPLQNRQRLRRRGRDVSGYDAAACRRSEKRRKGRLY